MAKKGSRLREFEKNHRVLDISTAQESRKLKKKEKKTRLAAAEAVTADSTEGNRSGSGHGNGSGQDSSKRINWVRLVGTVVLVAFLVMGGLSVKNILDLKEEEATLKERNLQLLQIKEELLMTMENVNSEEIIEEQARRELKLVKGNELVFYFPEDWELEKKHSDSGEGGDSKDSSGNKDSSDNKDSSGNKDSSDNEKGKEEEKEE